MIQILHIGNGTEKCYRIADAMLEARKAKIEEEGILAIKTKRKAK